MSKHHCEDVTGLPLVCWSHGWAFDQPYNIAPTFLRMGPPDISPRAVTIPVEMVAEGRKAGTYVLDVSKVD
jgi:hypothetical protein